MASAYAFVDALNRHAECAGLRRSSEPQRVVGP
jgi:hypothetical protein